MTCLRSQKKKAARSFDSFPSIVNSEQRVGMMIVITEAAEWKGMASGDNHCDISKVFTPWAGLGSATLTEDRVSFQSFFSF